MKHQTITVLGAGYVGLTTAALLAHSGFKVFVVEPNKERLDVIKTGRSFFYEEGLDSVIKVAIEKGNLIPTDSYKDSVPFSSVVFSSVGTPDNPDGSCNLTYVFSAAEETAKYIQSGSIYVQKSTVPVGTGKRIQEIFSKLGNHVDYVSNPEFLREGTALFDTLYFDRVVIGGDDKEIVKQVMDIYRQLEDHRDEIAKLADIPIKPHSGKYIETGLNSAELIKVSSNAFLALKISFANSIAKLSDKVGADIVEVMDAVGADKRIGRAFLNAGRGYGGGCFPKDVSGLIASGNRNGVDLEIMVAAQALNKSMPKYIVDKLMSKIGDNLTDKKVAVLGLSFKAGTSDVRKSPGIAIANILDGDGATVSVYDPQANKDATDNLNSKIVQSTSIEDCVQGVDAIIVATEWSDFINYPPNKYVSSNSKNIYFVDAINSFDIESIRQSGMTYIGVGR